MPTRVSGPDELFFLGSGGGRIHVAIQYISTAGLIFRFNGTQAHVDPGPGTMVRMRQHRVNPRLTSLVLVTHQHTDHCHDAPVVVEAMRENMKVKKGTLVTTKDYATNFPAFYRDLLKDIHGLDPGESVVHRGAKITATKTVHGDTPGVGFKINVPTGAGKDGNQPYVVGFSGDTEMFDGFSEQFADVDLLVLNLLRPDDVHCDRHACTAEVIPHVSEIKPKYLIITHFGARMLSDWHPKSNVPRQVKKIQEATGVPTAAAQDGRGFRIRRLLPEVKAPRPRA
ncbi:MAG: MBL fold metallo-hydrolase [Promethearchaeota archaeon]